MQRVRLVLARTACWALTFFVLMTMSSSAFAVPFADTVDQVAGYTTTDVVLLLVYVFLALFVSFMCSVSEAVLLSITPS